MTLLVFGKTGQVAREIRARADVVALGRDEADLSDPAACAAVIRARKPAAVINAAAYTAVDDAEVDVDLAKTINGETPGAMACECAALGIPFVHISTDYVFDGSGSAAFPAEHPTNPLGAYGQSKWIGERAVQAAGGTYAILRTSWVVSAHGKNFVKTMLDLGKGRDSMSIVADQVGGPTCAADIAAACLDIAAQLMTAPEKSGVYHFSGAPDTSWADFAREIFAQAGMPVVVLDIPTTDFPTPAARPLNSRLDNSRTEAVFGIPRPDWRVGLLTILKDLGALKE